MKKMTRLFYFLLGTFLISFASFAQTMDSAAVKPFNDGLDKMQKSDYAGALTDFKALWLPVKTTGFIISWVWLMRN